MKQSVKVSVMALIAMFAISTAAEAQTTSISFGSLNKLRNMNGSSVGVARNMTSSDVRTVAAIYFFQFF